MSPRVFIAALIALTLFFCTSLPAAYADSGSSTVDSLFNSGRSGQKAPASPSGSSSVPKEKPAQTPEGNTSMLGIFLRLILALIIVLALIYLLYHFVAKRSGKFRSRQALQNLGGVSVGSNRSVQLVQVAGQILVVGVGDTVQLLKEIDDPQTVAALTKPDTESETMEENVLKFLKWTADHTIERKKQEKTGNSGSLTQAMTDELSQLKEERVLQMNELLQEVKKNE
ncbi:MAG: flagellar biosynthetic protein FliO [Sporolactobacillus sp.]